MPRAEREKSRNQIYKRTDGRFTVVAERRSNHHTCRIRSWFRGNPEVTEAAPTERLAEEAARAIWWAYEHGQLQWEPAPSTLGELAERYLKRTDVTPKHLRSYDRQVRGPLVALGEATPLDELSTFRICQSFEARPWKPGTWNLARVRLGQLLGWAVERGWMDFDPTVRVPKMVDHKPMRPWLPYADWPALLAQLDNGPAFQLRAEFTLETGLRRSELCHMRRGSLHLGAVRPFIRVEADPVTGWEPKSTRSIRSIPLSARAIELAREALKMFADHPYLFGYRYESGGNWPTRIREACRAAEIRETDWHGLRRSAGARWLESGVALAVVSQWLGHANTAITEDRYAGLSECLLTQSVDKVDEHAAAWASGKVVALSDKRSDKRGRATTEGL